MCTVVLSLKSCFECASLFSVSSIRNSERLKIPNPSISRRPDACFFYCASLVFPHTIYVHIHFLFIFNAPLGLSSGGPDAYWLMDDSPACSATEWHNRDLFIYYAFDQSACLFWAHSPCIQWLPAQPTQKRHLMESAAGSDAAVTEKKRYPLRVWL
jgi:hypothetical protein